MIEITTWSDHNFNYICIKIQYTIYIGGDCERKLNY